MEELIRELDQTVKHNQGLLAAHSTMIEAHEKNIAHFVLTLDVVRETVHRIEVAQAGTAAKVTCTAPNMCLDLRKQLEELARLVANLVESRSEARGAWKLALLVAVPLGGACGVIFQFLINLIAGKHIP